MVKSASAQRKWCASSSEKRATSGPASMRTRLFKTKSFHVVGIGTQISGQALGGTEDAKSLGKLSTVARRCVSRDVILQRLSNNIRGPDAHLPGLGFQSLFELFFNPNVDPFHPLVSFDSSDCQTITKLSDKSNRTRFFA